MVGPHWDPRTLAYRPIALYTSFNFIGSCSGVRPLTESHNPPQPRPLLIVPELFCQGPRSASLSFPTPGIRIECIPTFFFLHRISCKRESLLPSSCAACTAYWYARLGAPSTFCNVSCLVYLSTEHNYQLVSPDTVGRSHTFTDFSFCLFPFPNLISYFGLEPTLRIMVGRVLDR